MTGSAYRDDPDRNQALDWLLRVQAGAGLGLPVAVIGFYMVRARR